MDGNFAAIGMISSYLLIAFNYKKIYLNATRDDTLKYLECYRKLIITGLSLCVISCIFLLYITNVESKQVSKDYVCIFDLLK